MGFRVSVSQQNLLSSSAGVPIDSKFTYSSGRCSEGVGLGWRYLLSDARPGFVAGVVGKGLFLPFYNFKQEEKPNVSVSRSQGPPLPAQGAPHSSSALLRPQRAVDPDDDGSAEAEGFLQGGVLRAEKYDGHVCPAKLWNAIPTDKHHLCRKHLKEDKQVFFFVYPRFCFLAGIVSPALRSGREAEPAVPVAARERGAAAHVPEPAGWRAASHGSAAAAYAGGHNFWSSTAKSIFLH